MKFKGFYALEEFSHVKMDQQKVLFQYNSKNQMLFYEVFEGISIVFNELETDELQCNKKTFHPMLSINYCYEGHVECEMVKGKRTCLSTKQLLLSVASATQEDFQVPSKYYKGITISVDLVHVSDKTLAVLADYQIDLERITKHLQHHTYCILDSETTIQHLFADLLKSPFQQQLPYLKLKVLETLFIISNMPLEQYVRTTDYIPHSKYKKMKKIAHYILKHFQEPLMISELCELFHVSESYLKKYFKVTFGESVHHYIQKTRIDQACQLLIETDLSILEIANSVGYKNSSKFAAIFKREKQQTPSQYRKEMRDELEHR
ncbi:helix-turn-helix domain-containing protein [Virgibacillus dokdonensis]|uniref:Xylose operon regulatory protein n=1 Tax=Virgibacillus dokdonensis TaxID=302167 RepID=A0A2K9IZX0_9BACI|nr:AraC family transcriptional regulator [Virgibacillus dokdonensis]AUJ24333.1 Xylose operon regulatory protein [Virgibacillus dokdonensis]